MVAVVCAVCMSLSLWFGINIRAAGEQKRRVEALRSVGANVSYAHENWRAGPEPSPMLVRIFGIDFCAEVADVRIPKGSASDDTMRIVSGFVHLDSLCIEDNPITDAGLEHITSLSELCTLSLGATDVTDAGMKSLGGLTSLRFLDLDDTKITDVGLESFTGLILLRKITAICSV
jgi:hypothetical protein